MTMYYHYKKERGADPSIPVELRNKGNKLILNMIIDSGASVSFIPRDIAEYLELGLPEETEDTQSLSGDFESYMTRVDAIIRKGHKVHRLKLQVAVPEQRTQYAVLGREGFFTKFEVTINHPLRKIRLKPYQPKPGKYRKEKRRRLSKKG